MKFISEYRDPEKISQILTSINSISQNKINIMEICGGHTMVIKKNGLDKLVSNNISFLSGPGCPVCVTAINEIDKLLYLASLDNVCICTFGDLFKVPGSFSSLLQEKANGHDIRIVYSVHDALRFAEQEQDKDFIFAGIGFETTIPTTAAAVLEAKQKNIKNFYLYSMHKTVPPAMKAILSDPENQINAFILPGHVSTIIGCQAYTFLEEEYKIPSCITGFEPLDILGAIHILVNLFEHGQTAVKNFYARLVNENGNQKACEIMYEVYEPCDASWRGLGIIINSGLKIKKTLADFDAEKKFPLPEIISKEYKGCICGEILKGKKKPLDCSLFQKVCTPDDPKGACMVSSEGVCAAWYLYG